MHGYYVICSQEGISTGACDYSLRIIPGRGSIPLALTVHSEPLTSAATIEAGIDGELLVAIDTGRLARDRHPGEVETRRRLWVASLRAHTRRLASYAAASDSHLLQPDDPHIRHGSSLSFIAISSPPGLAIVWIGSDTFGRDLRTIAATRSPTQKLSRDLSQVAVQTLRAVCRPRTLGRSRAEGEPTWTGSVT